jgi:hypothetical protein
MNETMLIFKKKERFGEKKERVWRERGKKSRE